MSYRFNPFTGNLDEVGSSSSGSVSIPEYTSDPVSPSARDAWVLRTGSMSGGGELMYMIGGMPVLSSGTGGGYTYQFKYRTDEGTTVAVALS